MNKLKLFLLSKNFLWRITQENEERNEADGWFPANRTYKHYLFDAVIHVQKGLMCYSKKYHIDKFIEWYKLKKK